MNIISNLYKIISKSDEKLIVQFSEESHPVFKAHFPSNPILPGFCHIEIVSEILSDTVDEVVLLKLRQKTLPNEIISYNLTTEDNKRKIKILDSKNKLIGNITYLYHTI